MQQVRDAWRGADVDGPLEGGPKGDQNHPTHATLNVINMI
jgi:hypothetical protein